MSFSTTLLAAIFLVGHCLGAITTDPSKANGKTFDYIIVGAGLTGITVAARLAENSSISILLIEAGNDDRKNAEVYDIYDFGQAYNTALDWAWPTEQGKTIHGGKTLGGSSSINGGLYTRGLSAQYDAWSSLLEDSDASVGWNWAGMLQYMEKSENFTAPSSSQKTKGANSVAADHGKGGPVQVSFPTAMFGGTQQISFVNATKNLFGITHCPDLCAGTANCVSLVPLTLNAQDSDHRSSSAEAYLTPVENTATNWLTLTGQMVTKITWASTSIPLKASGVQFGPSSGGSTRYSAKARREVILAAGAIQTPALLQLSGIGDTNVLTPLGITTLLNMKTVGRNLQEQTQDTITIKSNYTKSGTGPSDVIAYPNIYQTFGSKAASEVSTIQSSLATWAASESNNALSASALEQIYQVQANLIINDNAPILEEQMTSGTGTLSIDMWQLLPFSRGNVTITSTNPFTKPTVRVNFFSVPWDLTVQTQGARLAREIFHTSPLTKLYISESSPSYATVPSNGVNGTDADWQSWIIQQGTSGFHTVSHPIATAAMMRYDLGGVVNAQLTVYNTTNLRIVDASVVPLQLSAHLSSSLYGVAEKAADLIKAAQ
ncbi:hypothetical protein HWV62_8917 [Athelia sp. TMB]|nr:hypothetical protein HWV62_8917 [Athelia sp. TMB]